MTVFVWPLAVLALVFMNPWARWLLYRPERGVISNPLPTRDPILTLVTTLALSLATLSLVMMWMGFLGLRLDWRLAALICALISVLGWFVSRRVVNPPPNPTHSRIPPLFLRLRGEKGPGDRGGAASSTWMLILIGIIGVLILFNAVYWPFGIDDSITIYGWFGKITAQTGQLPVGELYATYPMLVPFSYAFTYQAAGWINEHVAALIPAVLSLGVLGSAYLLGFYLADRRTGLLAALLIALTPMFTHWASSGYVDLPAGFTYALAAVFLLRLDRYQRLTDAILVGVMAGISAWTKNSGLLIVISIALWILYVWARDRNWRYLVYGVAAGSAFLLVAGPWYAHNLITAGVLLPATGWTEKAARSALNLVPYIADTRYLLSGWIFTLGLVMQVIRLIQKRSSTALFLLIFYVPFFTVWWLLFSYDGRFLLVLTAFASVMGALALRDMLEFLKSRWQRYAEFRRVGSFTRIFIALILALPAASAAIDFKSDLLRKPLMSEEEKLHLRLGDHYDIALRLRSLPSGSRIWVHDLLLPYYADGVTLILGNMPTPEQLSSVDYWLLSPGMDAPTGLGDPLFSQNGYRLYKVKQN